MTSTQKDALSTVSKFTVSKFNKHSVFKTTHEWFPMINETVLNNVYHKSYCTWSNNYMVMNVLGEYQTRETILTFPIKSNCFDFA